MTPLLAVALALFIAGFLLQVGAFLLGRRDALAAAWSLLGAATVCNIVGWCFYAAAVAA